MQEIKIIEPLTLVGIQKWLIEQYRVKKSGNPFTISDVQGYIGRGYIPRYLDYYNIELIKVEKEESYYALPKAYRLVPEKLIINNK